MFCSISIFVRLRAAGRSSSEKIGQSPPDPGQLSVVCLPPAQRPLISKSRSRAGHGEHRRHTNHVESRVAGNVLWRWHLVAAQQPVRRERPYHRMTHVEHVAARQPHHIIGFEIRLQPICRSRSRRIQWRPNRRPTPFQKRSIFQIMIAINSATARSAASSQ
jgi:hypothetical protein